ncbi:MAG: hypothetical protein ACK42Z_05730 [Candidatus Kapaibacteriota bacterium]
MKTKLVLIFWLLILLNSCELIKLTDHRRKKIDPNPKNSIGLVFLLIQEVKENNIIGASKLFVGQDTSVNLEKVFELEDKLKRFGRNISKREVTFYKVDTLNSTEHIVLIEFDYLIEYFFVAKKYSDYWFIRTFGEK